MNIKQIIIGTLLSLPVFGYAQTLKCPPIDATGNGTQRIDITLGAGPTLLYGDINHRSNVGYGIALKGDYKVYKGFYAGLEVQGGQLAATGQVNYAEPTDWDPRYVKNRYWAGSLNATFYPYRFIVNERDLFKKSKFEQLVLNGLYLGIGIGAISNSYSEIERRSVYDDLPPVNGMLPDIDPGLVNGPFEIDGTGAPITNEDGDILYSSSTSSTLLPVINAGLAVPLNKYYSAGRGYFSVVVNTQFNFSNGENLDGYDPLTVDGSRPSGARNDMYNFTYVGVRYSF